MLKNSSLPRRAYLCDLDRSDEGLIILRPQHLQPDSPGEGKPAALPERLLSGLAPRLPNMHYQLEHA